MKDLKSQLKKVLSKLHSIRRYLPLLFCLLLLGIYGFVVYRVQVFNSQTPSSTDVLTQSQTASVPHIDPSVLTQLKSLQDNSVSVQSLFDSARSNPFQE